MSFFWESPCLNLISMSGADTGICFVLASKFFKLCKLPIVPCLFLMFMNSSMHFVSILVVAVRGSAFCWPSICPSPNLFVFSKPKPVFNPLGCQAKAQAYPLELVCGLTYLDQMSEAHFKAFNFNNMNLFLRGDYIIYMGPNRVI